MQILQYLIIFILIITHFINSITMNISLFTFLILAVLFVAGPTSGRRHPMKSDIGLKTKTCTRMDLEKCSPYLRKKYIPGTATLVYLTCREIAKGNNLKKQKRICRWCRRSCYKTYRIFS